MIHEGMVDAIVFRDFVKRLMVGAQQPIFLAVDGAPAHARDCELFLQLFLLINMQHGIIDRSFSNVIEIENMQTG